MSEDKNIIFDTDQLLAALRSGVDINDCKDGNIEALMKVKEDETLEELEESDGILNLSAIGAKYKIGGLDFSCALGNLVLLSSVNSPITCDENLTELSLEDAAIALYILAKGRDVMAPIMAIKQRINDVASLRGLIKDSPVMMDKIIEKVEDISKAREYFALDAIQFYEENFVGEDFQKIVDEMVKVIVDVFKSSPTGETQNTFTPIKKKIK